MFNIDFELVEINNHGTHQYVSSDKSIAILSGSYAITFFFKGFYGICSISVETLNSESHELVLDTYCSFKTDPSYREYLYTDVERFNYLLW